MRFIPPILIALALVISAQDTPRPGRPTPCEDEKRARTEAEIRAEQSERAYEILSRQWLQLPADTKALASLQYEVARLRYENARLQERNADLSGFQIAADALPAGELVAIYNAIATRANDCDRREAAVIFREWQEQELNKLIFTIRRK